MFGAKSFPEALLTAVVLSSLSQLSVKVHSTLIHILASLVILIVIILYENTLLQPGRQSLVSQLLYLIQAMHANRSDILTE